MSLVCRPRHRLPSGRAWRPAWRTNSRPWKPSSARWGLALGGPLAPTPQSPRPGPSAPRRGPPGAGSPQGRPPSAPLPPQALPLRHTLPLAARRAPRPMQPSPSCWKLPGGLPPPCRCLRSSLQQVPRRRLRPAPAARRTALAQPRSCAARRCCASATGRSWPRSRPLTPLRLAPQLRHQVQQAFQPLPLSLPRLAAPPLPALHRLWLRHLAGHHPPAGRQAQRQLPAPSRWPLPRFGPSGRAGPPPPVLRQRGTGAHCPP